MVRESVRELSAVGRGLLALGASIGAVVDPKRADLVAVVGDTTGEFVLHRIRNRLRQSSQGRLLLAEKPSLTRILNETTLQDWIQNKSKSSFGYCYARFMLHHKFEAKDRPDVQFIRDPELQFVMRRYRECHDLWHVLNGLRPTILGELAEKWFEAAHTQLPVAVLSSLFGPLALRSQSDRVVLATQLIPWALVAGSKCEDLFVPDYEALFGQDIRDVRRQLNIETPQSWLNKNHTKVLFKESFPEE